LGNEILMEMEKEALDYTLWRTFFGRGHTCSRTDYIMKEQKDIVLKLTYEE